MTADTPLGQEPSEQDWADFAAWAERDRLDAARYRWFRQPGEQQQYISRLQESELDAAIDAALNQPKEKQE